MSAQRYALNNFIRNGQRFVSCPHPSPSSENKEREEVIIGNGLVESVIPFVNFVKYVPPNLQIPAWTPLHKVHSPSLDEKLTNEIEWPVLSGSVVYGPENKKCSRPLTSEVSVQTDDDLTRSTYDPEQRMDKLRWEMENKLGEDYLSSGAYTDAFTRFKLSAEHGNLDAMVHLAECYSDGFGCTKSMRRAYEWWDRAARGGDIDSLYQMAVCHLRGEGVPRSVPTGRQIMKEAAERGSASAAYYMVVLMFREGRSHETGQFIKTALKSEENEKEMKTWLDRKELDFASKVILREHLRHG